MLQTTCQSKYTTVFSPERIYRQQTWTSGIYSSNVDHLNEDDSPLSNKTAVEPENRSFRNSCLQPFEVGNCKKPFSKAEMLERKSLSASSTLLRNKRLQVLVDHQKPIKASGNGTECYQFFECNGRDTTSSLHFQNFNPIIKGIQFTSSISHKVTANKTRTNEQEEGSQLKLPTVTNQNGKKNENDKNNKEPNNLHVQSSTKLKNSFTKFVEAKCSSRKVKEKISLKLFHRTRDSVNTLSLNRKKSHLHEEPIDHDNNINNNNDSNSHECIRVLKKTTRKPAKTYLGTGGDKTNKKNIVSVSPCKRKKIYYSEKQSEMTSGAPSVPPCTPAYYQYDTVNSLADLKSQRNVVQKLVKLECRQHEKEKKVLKRAKELEEKKKAEELQQLLQKQRRQIYYLNEIMTKYENERFLEFKQQQSGAPV